MTPFCHTIFQPLFCAGTHWIIEWPTPALYWWTPVTQRGLQRPPLPTLFHPPSSFLLTGGRRSNNINFTVNNNCQRNRSQKKSYKLKEQIGIIVQSQTNNKKLTKNCKKNKNKKITSHYIFFHALPEQEIKIFCRPPKPQTGSERARALGKVQRALARWDSGALAQRCVSIKIIPPSPSSLPLALCGQGDDQWTDGPTPWLEAAELFL